MNESKVKPCLCFLAASFFLCIIAGCEGCGSTTLVGDISEDSQFIEDSNANDPIEGDPILDEREEAISDFIREDAGIEDSVQDVDAESPILAWARTYGSEYHEWATSVQLTIDNGYAIAGYTDFNEMENWDIWILKLDTAGNVIWQKAYVGVGSERPTVIQKTFDGGYIVSGETFWGVGFIQVLKLDSVGNVVWKKEYNIGTSGSGDIQTILQDREGGYIMTGNMVYDFNNRLPLIMKLDADGNFVWLKLYDDGDERLDYVSSIAETSDNGYILTGETASRGMGRYDVWVVKLERNGQVEWQKTYGDRETEKAYSIQQISGSGYIVAGYTKSFGVGNWDVFVLKLDTSGNVVWQKAYGYAEGNEWATSILQNPDGGFTVTGGTDSTGEGYNDCYLLKLDEEGNIVWQKTYGGASGSEWFEAIQRTSDGGYITVGGTGSFGAGYWDFWILKLDANGSIDPACPPYLGQDSFFVATDADVVTFATLVSPVEESVTVTDIAVSSLDTSAIVETQCSR